MAPRGASRRRTDDLATAKAVEASVAGRPGLRLPVFRGEQAVGVLAGSGAFALVGTKSFLDRSETSVEILAVSEWMRFGNAVRQ